MADFHMHEEVEAGEEYGTPLSPIMPPHPDADRVHGHDPSSSYDSGEFYSICARLVLKYDPPLLLY